MTKVSTFKCSAKDCNKGAVRDCGFFVTGKPDIGMTIPLCQSHAVYFNALTQLIDGAISFAYMNGKWVIPIPTYSQYIQPEDTAPATATAQQEGTFVDPAVQQPGEVQPQ